MQARDKSNVAPVDRETPLPLDAYCGSGKEVVARELRDAKKTLLGLRKPTKGASRLHAKGGNRSNFPRHLDSVVIKGVDFVKGAPFGLACGDEFLDSLEFNVNKMRGYTRATHQDHSSLPHSLSHISTFTGIRSRDTSTCMRNFDRVLHVLHVSLISTCIDPMPMRRSGVPVCVLNLM